MSTAKRIDLASIDQHLPSVIDVFICCASYESRCLKIAGNLATSRVKRAFVAENMNHVEFHGGNAPLLLKTLGNAASHVSLDTTDPIGTADGLMRALGQVQDDSRTNIVVDITTFTRESLLILIALLRFKFRSAQITLLYVAAKEYSLNEPDASKWLSRGIAEVRSVLGYTGIVLPSRRLHLIILCGFEYERAVELIRNYEPSSVALGYDISDEPVTEKHRAAQAHNLERIRAMYSNARDFKFPAYDPHGTKEAIVREVARVPDANVVVAPMNTKLSTVGAALAALENERIQLCYAQAVVYNYLNYSSPSEICYSFRL